MISLDRLVAALGISEEDDEDLTVLEDLRDAAVAFLETQTGRRFGAVEAYEEIVTGTGGRTLYLSDTPAIGDDYEAVTVHEYEYPGASPTVISEGVSEGFELRRAGREGMLVRWGSRGVWTNGYEYLVRYSRGYEEDQGPKDIERLVVDLVALKRNLAGREAMRSETIGGYSYTRFGEGDLDSIDGARSTVLAWRKLAIA